MPTHWRAILAELAEDDPKALQHIAETCGILSTRTLRRWIEGSSPKNPLVLRTLGRVVPPEKQQEMMASLQREFPTVFKEEPPAFPLPLPPPIKNEEEIPPIFTQRLLKAHATLASPQRQWTLTNMVFEQIMRQLDPENEGLGILFAQCVPPRTTAPMKRIRSLHLYEGAGTGIWQTRQIETRCYLGIESMVGQIVAASRPFIAQTRAQIGQIPEFFLLHEKIQSLAIYPVEREGKIAGGLLLCSTQEDFFSPPRKNLLEMFTHMFSLAFYDREFYPPQDIALHTLPMFSEQRPILSHTRERITLLLKQQPLTPQQAELVILQDLETLLLQQEESHATTP